MEASLVVNRLWSKAAWLSLVLFVVGAFTSRSLVEFSKYLALLISLKFFWTLLREGGGNRIQNPGTGRESSSVMVWALFLLSLIGTGYLLIWLISHLEGGLLGLFIASVIWPLLIGFVGWRRGMFSNQETQYWWFLNGLLWWFTVTFFLRDVEVNTYSYVQGILSFAFSFTLPMTVFYLFVKMSGDFFTQRAGVLFRVVWIAVGAMAIMGLPSLVSLDRYWPDWIKVADALAVSYNQGRLSSFHFVLDTGNILAQSFFLTLGGALYGFFSQGKTPKDWQGLRIGFSLFLFLFFLFTFTKLLIPLVFMLLIVFLSIVFKDYYRYYFLVLMIVVLGLGGALLSTSKQFRDFSRDLVPVSQSLRKNLLAGDMEKLLEEIIDTDLSHSASFIYRLQHHIWGGRILFTDPLSGVGPYAYIDYVIANYREDLLRLPYLLSSGSPDIGLEEKREMIMAGDAIERSLLSPHSDWVMIISSGGIPGMFFYYGFFGVLLIYFGSCYRRGRNLFFLGVVFALLAMLASGLTEANFKSIHFHILTLYALLFLGSKFVVATDDPQIIFSSENSKTKLN